MSYPGLPDDKYHALARKYVPKGAGSVFTFGLKGGFDAGVKLVSNVKLFSHLANIGDTRSLIIHPASTTHRQLTDEQKVAVRRRPGRGAAVDRHRGQGRHHRRPGAGAGLAHGGQPAGYLRQMTPPQPDATCVRLPAGTFRILVTFSCRNGGRGNL